MKRATVRILLDIDDTLDRADLESELRSWLDSLTFVIGARVDIVGWREPHQNDRPLTCDEQ